MTRKSMQNSSATGQPTNPEPPLKGEAQTVEKGVSAAAQLAVGRL